MAITLYHDVPSSNCDRVKIALDEKGLSYERIRDRSPPESTTEIEEPRGPLLTSETHAVNDAGRIRVTEW